MNVPVVSVPVVTYNSSATILETLDSIYYQTYKHIELIVSDDASKDNTVAIVSSWINDHRNRFIRVKLLTSDINKGVTANYARAAAVCEGVWVKPIDGDDVLYNNCIEEYVRYVYDHPSCVCLFSKVDVFGNDRDVVSFFTDVIFDYSFFHLPQEEQYDWLISGNSQPIPSVTEFYNKPYMDSIGIRYDERIPMLEDWPRWIQYVENKVKLDFIDKSLARYRVSGSASICSGETYRSSFKQSLALLYIHYQFRPLIKKRIRLMLFYRYVYSKKIISNSFGWRIACFIMRCISYPERLIVKLYQRS